MNELYRWRGGCENVLRHGARSPVTLLVLPALFDEANRMRRFTVSVMRLLAASNIGSLLPDLPGTGESETALCDTTVGAWHDAVSAFSGQVFGSIAFRGGALLDGDFNYRWQLAPETGERLIRDLVRATALSSGAAVSDLDSQARSRPTRLAGHLVSPAMYRTLHEATVVRGAHISTAVGPKLWRAPEPTEDATFAQLVADEIATWVKSCAAS